MSRKEFLRRLLLLKKIDHAESEANETPALSPATKLAEYVVDYYSRLGHACSCDVVLRDMNAVALVSISTVPKETAAALAKAQQHIERRTSSLFAIPTRLYIHFRSQQQKKERDDAPLKEDSIMVQETVFEEFEKFKNGEQPYGQA